MLNELIASSLWLACVLCKTGCISRRIAAPFLMRPEQQAKVAQPANLLDLQRSVRDALEDSGALNRIRARLRAEVLKAVHPEPDKNKPVPPRETIALNALIAEYLRYNHYDNAASVFEAEIGPSGKAQIERGMIEEDIGLSSEDQGIPLLYGMMTVLKDQKKKRQQQAAAEAALERRLAQHQEGEEGRGEGNWAERVHHEAEGRAAPLHFSA